MINTELCKQWVAELKSGKWGKDKGFLRRDDKYCCWGVCMSKFCDNTEICINTYPTYQENQNEPHLIYSFNGQTGEPPSFVLEKFGITPDQANILISLNDNNETFQEVINKLEEWISEAENV